MKNYILLIFSILALCFWVVRGSHAWTVIAEFDLPTNSTDITEVLVSDVAGDYSQAHGQRSGPGASSVLIGGFEIGEMYYLAARRLKESGGYSDFSNEIEFTPYLVDENAGKIIATWEYSGPSDGFRLYMEACLIWEGNDSEQRQAEVVCSLYGDTPINFTMTAYAFDYESDHSEIFQATPVRKARNIFQLLPWDARKNLCEGLQSSQKACFFCHTFNF